MNTNSLTASRVLMIARTFALFTFLALGFAFDAWAVAWIAFLVPAIVRRWYALEERHSEKSALGYGIDARQPYPTH